ncbi:MAG TPA: glycosyltransferase [Pyrinomonadaceae bacterium]|nr:glycosyltransferase [Pyrinomonadaceae bacterium]
MKPVVLQLIDSFHQGGSERQALQLTRLLRESGRFDVRLACLNPDGVLRAEIEDLQLGDVPAFPLTAFYNLNAMAQARRFRRFLKSNEVQLLHTHDFYTNIFGMFSGALARVPARVASMRETGGMRTAGQLRLQRYSYSFAHKIVGNSESVRTELVKQGIPKEKTAVIYNGIDVQRVTLDEGASRSDSLARVGLPQSLDSSSLCVTLVANMRHEVKDYPMFLRAAKRVHQEVPNAVFLLAGEGELMTSLQSLAAELEIEGCTYFLGRCEAMAELLNISDVCVLSSKAEGFSNSILEYMAAGKPVVATNVGGAPEAIVEGVTGFLVPAGNDENMAARIIELLVNHDRRFMGARGRQIVLEKFSPEAQLARTESLYNDLLSQPLVLDEGSRTEASVKRQEI